MEIREWAQQLLFSNDLESKVKRSGLKLSQFTDQSRVPDSFTNQELKKLPGRCFVKQGLKKADLFSDLKGFPKLGALEQPLKRAQMLHFFANHEMLAIELMAQALLKYPNAPHALRLGLVQTISEEQVHLQLYIDQIRRLGLDFGDLELNCYFWNAFAPVNSIEKFLALMSLTYEQANLDHALFFQKIMEKVGDSEIANVLKQVRQDEIGHVKFGLQWLQKQKPEQQSLWSFYQSQLVWPTSPERAKGLFFDQSGRLEAGIPKDFLEELKRYQGSKGRPPLLWDFNPYQELGTNVSLGSGPFEKKISDLELAFAYCARPDDWFWCRNLPSPDFLKYLADRGVKLPQMVKRGELPNFVNVESSELGRESVVKLGGVKPWGWSIGEVQYLNQTIMNETFSRAIQLAQGTNDTEVGQFKLHMGRLNSEWLKYDQIFSKVEWSRWFNNWCLKNYSSLKVMRFEVEQLGRSFTKDVLPELQEGMQVGRTYLLKQEKGLAGRGHLHLKSLAELDAHRFKVAESYIVEPFVERQGDFSIQARVSSDRSVKIESPRPMWIQGFHYQGTCLGPRKYWWNAEMQRLWAESKKEIEQLIRDAADRLLELGFIGSFGVDCFFYMNTQGHLAIHPFVELNARYTMGRVALEIEKKFQVKEPSFWWHVSKKDWENLSSKCAEQIKTHSVVLTTDPTGVSKTQTVLLLGVESMSVFFRHLPLLNIK